ncbi:MAG: hypothetical protein LBP23_00320 [Treponema sp.]|nr:hypothetical protein [Treponema sp.]
MADPLAGGAEYLPLHEGALAYMVIDVKDARPVLESLSGRFPLAAGEKQTKEMLDRTGSAALAVFGADGGGHMQAAAWGRYPAKRAGISFALDRNWKKRKSAAGYSYWYSERNRMSVALSASQAFVSVKTAGPEEPPEPAGPPPGVLMPGDFAAFRQGASLALWIPEPRSSIDRLMRAMEIPLQIPAEEVFAALHPGEGTGGGQRYEALLRLRTPSPSQAKALVSLFSMARYLIAGTTEDQGSAALGAILFANPPAQDDRYITLKTAAMKVEDVVLFFELFMAPQGRLYHTGF